MKTIVAIFAHPDDEAFWPGDTIAKLSKDHLEKSEQKEVEESAKSRS